MSSQPTFDLEQIKTTFGFDPYAASEGVYACGLCDGGPRRGYLCVFTTDTAVKPALYDRPNYSDASYGQAAAGPGQDAPGRGLVYYFSPLKQSGGGEQDATQAA